MKKVKKIISILLVFAMLAQCFPLTAYAKTNTESSEKSEEEVEEVQEVDKEATIEKEIVEMREPNKKYFEMSDGSTMVALYNENIHYQLEDGSYEEINSSLIEETDEYKNDSSDYAIKFAKKTNSKKLATLSKDGNKISWYLNDQKKVKMKNITLKKDEGDIDENLLVGGAHSRVEYQNILDGITLRYDNSGSSIKESIIAYYKEALEQELTFTYDVGDLEIIKNEDNSINIVNPKTGEVVYYIDSLYMYDDNGEYSSDIEVNLTKEKNQYKITLIPNKEWINDKSRAYPIVIDPSITTSQDYTQIDDTFVYSGDANNSASTRVNADILRIGNSSFASMNHASGRALIKFNLPTLTSGDQIVQAKLYIASYPTHTLGYAYPTTEIEFDVHKMTADWNGYNAYYSNTNSFDPKITDYAVYRYDTANPIKSYNFNITSIVRDWYVTGDNYGVMIKEKNEASWGSRPDAYFFSSDCAAGYASARPIISIVYRNQTGLEDYMSYQTSTIGNSTVNTNNYNGNLVLTHNDISTTGNLLPAAIYHTYNTNDKNINIGYGNGFRLNYNQTVQLVTIGSIPYAKYIDEDGTAHYFNKQSDTVYTDEDGLNLTLTLSGSIFTMTDKAGNKSEFTNNSGIYKLTKIIDTNSNQINITYTNGYITGITDGASKNLTLTYTNNLLTNITNNVNEQINYGYTGANLTTITYLDNTTTTYAYESNLLKTITGTDNSKLTYDYYPGSASRVKSIKQDGTDGTDGNTLSINYLEYATKVTDNTGISTIYLFDTLGRTTSVTSSSTTSERYGNVYNYGTTGASNNKLISESNYIKPVTSKISNSSFELDTLWTLQNWGYTNGTCGYNTSEKTLGNRSLKCSSASSLTAYPLFNQGMVLKRGKTYTLSFKVKTNIITKNSDYADAGAIAIIYYDDADGNLVTKRIDRMDTNNQWKSYSYTFTLESNARSDAANLVLGMKMYTGDVYYDEVQIEEGEVANPYNMINNSSFDNGTSFWAGSDVINTNIDKSIVVDNKNVLNIIGEYNKNKFVYQTVNITGNAGDTLLVNGYVKSRGVPNDDSTSTYTKVPVRFDYTDGTSEWTNIFIDSSPNEWQYFSREVKANKNYSKFSVYLSFAMQDNYIYYDDIGLFKDISGNAYTYDANGNLVSSSDLAKQNSTFTYDNRNQLMSSITTNGSKYTYEYDSIYKNRIIKGTSYDLTYSLNYDNKGNNTKVTITPKNTIEEIADGQYYIRRNTTNYYLGVSDTNVVQTSNKDIWTITKQSNGYYEIIHNNTDKALDIYSASTANYANVQIYYKNHTVAQQYAMVKQSDGSFSFKASYANKCVDVYDNSLANDANVNSYDCNNSVAQKWYLEKVDASTKYIETSATYDTTGDFLTGMTDQKGNTTNYSYNDKGLVSSITNPNSISTNYLYDVNHNLTSVTSSNHTNNYTYSNNKLSTINYNNLTYTFNYDVFGNNTNIYVNDTLLVTNTYAANNGNYLSRTYGNGDVTSYTYDSFNRVTGVTNETGTINYLYDNMNNLAVSKDSYNNTNTYYKYDISKRLLEINQNNNFKINYSYDTKSNINKLEYTLNNIKYSNNYVYDNDNKITKVTNNLSSEVSYSYDNLSRVNNTTYKNTLDNSTYSTNYTYEDINSDKTTTSIKKIETGNNTYEYTYDTLGNIAEVKINNVLTNKYYYDDINQLIKQDDLVNNKTTEYTYDNGGNILSKKYYTYNTTTLIDEDTYTYSTTRLDQLTNYNSQAITYDSIGNPLTIGTKTLNWVNGRQLQSITDGSNTYSYKYNEDGIRTSKTVNGVTANYKLQGSNIIFEQTNDNMIYYIYDASGSVIGLKYNNDIYYYEKNIQNDITGIMDDSFNLLATYEYDSWGNILSIKDTNGNVITDSSNIALVNPFRYRSYYYDSEIGMYYLNSRYYNQEWGRFINVDGTIGANGHLIGYNLYTYVNNNPILYYDPNGRNFNLIPMAPGHQKSVSQVKAALENQIQLQNQCSLTNKVSQQNSKSPLVLKSSSSSMNGHNNVPTTGKPNTTVRKPNGDWRTYGPDGRAVKDTDFSHPQDHPDLENPHFHDWDWDKTPPRQGAYDNNTSQKIALGVIGSYAGYRVCKFIIASALAPSTGGLSWLYAFAP